MAVNRRPVLAVLKTTGAPDTEKGIVPGTSVGRQVGPDTKLPSRHSTTTLVGEATIVPDKSTAVGRRTARFDRRVMSKPLIKSGPARKTPTRIWLKPLTFVAAMGLFTTASGAGPFRLNPAGAHGVLVVKEEGSFRQTVPAAWAGRTTDGIPRKIPSRSNGTSPNISF